MPETAIVYRHLPYQLCFWGRMTATRSPFGKLQKQDTLSPKFQKSLIEKTIKTKSLGHGHSALHDRGGIIFPKNISQDITDFLQADIGLGAFR